MTRSITTSMALSLAGIFALAVADWEPVNGPYDVRIDDISAGRYQQLDYVFLANWDGYPMRSINGDWILLGQPIQINHAVAIDCGDANARTVYAGMPGYMGGDPEGVWKSVDGGDSWSDANGTPPNNIDNKVITTIAVDPYDPNRVFVGCSAFDPDDDVTYRTENGGETWDELEPNPLEHICWVSALYFHPTVSNTIFLVAGAPLDMERAEEIYGEFPQTDQFWKGLYRSTNNGQDWTQIYDPTPTIPYAFTSVVVNPNATDNVYLGTSDGVLHSDDSGTNWNWLPNPTTTYHGVSGLVFVGNALWITTEEGVFSTIDNGINWTAHNDGFPGPWNRIMALEQDPYSESQLYCWLINALFKYSAISSCWYEVVVNLSEANIMDLCLYRDYWFHAMNVYGNQFWSDDIGTNWKTTFCNPYAGGTGGPKHEADVNPDDHQIVFSKFVTNINKSFLWRSTNGGFGCDWILVAERPSYERHSHVDIAPSQPDYVYFSGSYYPQVMRSTDGGITFVDRPLPVETYLLESFAVDPQYEQKIYAGLDYDVYTGTPIGIYVSVNGGNTWTLTQNGLPAASDANAIAVDPWDPGKVLAAMSNGNIYKYDTGSQSWSLFSQDVGNVTDLDFHPFDNQQVFATIAGEGVLHSMDGGVNWTAINEGLGDVGVNGGLTIIPTIPTMLYLGTDDGIYRYEVINSSTIASDQNWRGYVGIWADVAVEQGVTLTVYPGAEVVFQGEYGLDVSGEILSVGEEAVPITWSGADEMDPWSGIHLLSESSTSSRFERNKFNYFNLGIHCDGVTLTNAIDHCNFTSAESGTGVYLWSSGTDMTNCYFLLCDQGIFYYNCESFEVVSCTFDHCLSGGLGAQICSNFTVDDGYFTSCMEYGIYLDYTHDFSITNTDFWISTIGIEMWNSHHYLVEGCTIENGQTGIKLMYCSGGRFQSNVIPECNYGLGGFYSYDSNPNLRLNDIGGENGQIRPYALRSCEGAAPILYVDNVTPAANRLKVYEGETNYPIYVESDAFPYLNKGHNDILRNDADYHIYDTTPGPPPRLVRNNFWGGVPNDNYFYPLPPVGHYIYIPYDDHPNYPGLDSVEPPTEEEILWEEAYLLESQGEYAQAQEVYYDLIAAFPDSFEAVSSIPALFSCAKGIGTGFAELQSYYEGLAQQPEHVELANIAESYATHCKTAQEEFALAIADYDAIIANPESFIDSVCALINRENVLGLAELLGSGTASSEPGTHNGWSEHRDRINQLIDLLNDSEENQASVSNVPKCFWLALPYPNPFNPITTISYALPVASVVNLSVYDISGRMVATLVDGRRDAGIHRMVFDGSALVSGVYIYRLKAGDFTASGKIVLVK